MNERPIIEEPQKVEDIQIVEETVHMDIWRRFLGIIIDPLNTFKVIKSDPKVLIPLTFILSISVMIALFVLPESKAFSEEIVAKMGQNVPKQSMLTTGIWSVVGILILYPIMFLLQALVLFIYDQLSVGKAKFKQLFAVVLYAGIPNVLMQVIATILTKSIGLKATMNVRLSLALFWPGNDQASYLFQILNQANFFAIWGLILLIIGGSIVMGKDAKKLAIYTIILWLIYITGKGAITAFQMNMLKGIM
ncbi:MAG: Yip1 family protein [Acidobacteriota bacterium]